ncbi:hypothetical protein IVG45_18575 [Methylomonas sp. LL1]|uniref:hypothetical protein n=1 Tax=Methylomonas sp. LL1 TaxID=2785785 RepID=UPI0018C37687|nr:hypothetical protein [Methylomonas sp. LL1]QPK62813.1 hypothetical protein IVG45_18575 [Methylomonas sp. LL1]
MSFFYKLIPFLLAFTSSSILAAGQQQSQPAPGPAGLTPQQHQQQLEKMHQQQEKMQEVHDKAQREMNAQRLAEEIKK